MKTFFAAAVAPIIVAVGAMYAFDEAWQCRADQVLMSPTNVRVPEHGSTHNLVGKVSSSIKDHGTLAGRIVGEQTRNPDRVPQALNRLMRGLHVAS